MSCISVQKHVNYGDVILIVGDCHKIQWNVQNGIQMKWNQDDIWTATIDSCCLPINYRYVVVNESSRQIVEWEDGINRVFNSHQDVHDIWGNLRIILKFITYLDSNITLNLYSHTGRQKIPLIKSDGQYTSTFFIPNKSIHQLAYKYQSNDKWERGAARMIHNHSIINNIIHVTDSAVDFNLNYNRIFQNLYVGSFIYIDEISFLQELGVNAILNLQTVEDLINKDLPEDYFDQLQSQCQSLDTITFLSINFYFNLLIFIYIYNIIIINTSKLLQNQQLELYQLLQKYSIIIAYIIYFSTFSYIIDNRSYQNQNLIIREHYQ